MKAQYLEPKLRIVYLERSNILLLASGEAENDKEKDGYEDDFIK